MLILGLDMATHCGYARREDNGEIHSGVWDLSPRKKAQETEIHRLIRFRQMLTDHVEAHGWGEPDVIAYEDTRFFRGGAATRVYFGMLAFLQLWAHERGIPITGANVSSVKKFATGAGNAKKDQMVAAAMRRWPGNQFESDDEVDARWVAEFVYAGRFHLFPETGRL